MPRHFTRWHKEARAAEGAKNVKPKTVYQRIMEAARLGRGLHLSNEEVAQLAADDAIETRADKDDFNVAGTPDEDLT